MNGYTTWAGGGIACYAGWPTICDCNVTANTAQWGGGISCHHSNALITGCVISGNTATDRGGGISCHAAGISYPEIECCIITGNEAMSGGGISCQDLYPLIVNSVISDNTASNYGGAIYEKHYVNTPPFKAGMKRYPLKRGIDILEYLHGNKTIESCSI